MTRTKCGCMLSMVTLLLLTVVVVVFSWPTHDPDVSEETSLYTMASDVTSDASLPSLVSTSPSVVSSADELYKLTDEYFKWKVQEFPQQASSIGFNDDTAAHLDSLNVKTFQLRKISCEQFLEKAKALDTSGYSEEDLLNYTMYLYELNTYINNFKYMKFFAPINARGGPQHALKRTLQTATVLESHNDFKKLVSRYREFPRQADEQINLMRENMIQGLMPSNWSMIGVVEQMDNLLVNATESFFFAPFLDININITEEEKEFLQREGEEAVWDLLQSFKKLRDFIENEYYPSTRPLEGVWSLPGGVDYYRACLNFHTSTNMTPKEVHDLGLSEVKRIQQEVAQTAIELGMANMSLAEISARAQDDPSQKFISKEDLLNTYKEAVYNKFYPLMDQVVNQVPSINVSVEENLSGSGYAAYSPPPKDGSKPGIFYINAKIYNSHKRYEVTALSLHETIPGHHLQLSNLLLNPDIPDFRKNPDYYRYEDIPAKFPLHSAYTEGWGLYCEYLGEELGLYQDPYQRLGRHSFELLRASRLVVDTGLHAFQWTRQEAINYLLENTAMSEEAIKGQIDRYITWPGQACSYKVGEIKIKELRQRTEEALGQLFRLQDFHDVILGCAGPLDILEGCVNNYIRKLSA